MTDAERALNGVRRGGVTRPFVVAQPGQSLDGRIAPPSRPVPVPKPESPVHLDGICRGFSCEAIVHALAERKIPSTPFGWRRPYGVTVFRRRPA